MPALVLLALGPLSGKTTIAVALAQRLRLEGKAVSLSRVGEDANAAADRELFTRIVGPATAGTVTLTEAPAGEQGVGADRVIVVSEATIEPAQLAQLCQPLAPRMAGVILNRVPARRLAAVRADVEASGVKVFGAMPEDHLLAAPTLGEVADALSAEKMFFDSTGDRPLKRIVIASISADPGQGYFDRTGAETVIVRSDKPDLQLAALNAGASAMIVTGDLPILGYVLDRAEEDMVPLLRTRLDTVGAVKIIENLYATRPFAGGAGKLQRAAALAAEIDLAPITS